MPHAIKHKAKKAGLAPGTMIFTGKESQEAFDFSVLAFNETQCITLDSFDWEILRSNETPDTNYWINVHGVHHVEEIQAIGQKVGLHQLTLEDIVNVHHRPKQEFFEGYLYIVCRMFHEHHSDLTSEQISIVAGTNWLITFQEFKGDIFGELRNRIADPQSRLRKFGINYLVYALIDTLVDHNFILLEKIGDGLEKIEVQILDNPTQEVFEELNRFKRDLLILRKSIWPLREIINRLMQDEKNYFSEHTLLYFRDVYDHAAQSIEILESYRDFMSSLTDLYLSSLSQKMNNVMQFLTIIGTIFIPLTFIVGVYGMNFKYMPETQWYWGYPGVMILMALISLLIILYFRKKKWL